MSEDFDYHEIDDPIPDGMVCCPRCDGWRQVDCHCGGDLCVCDNYGEEDCPMCHGEGVVTQVRYDKWLERRREYAKVMREALDNADQK